MKRPVSPVRLRRVERGERAVEVAMRAALHPSRLSVIENGWVSPRPDELKRLARALRCPVSALVSAQ